MYFERAIDNFVRFKFLNREWFCLDNDVSYLIYSKAINGFILKTEHKHENSFLIWFIYGGYWKKRYKNINSM